MSDLPLSTWLSQTLVAFTIEFDNEFERQMPHRTTRYGATHGSRHEPWLVSLAMWSNCMQFIGEEGVRVGELENLARTATNLNGMERWGYVLVQPDPADSRLKPPRSDWVVRATAKGREAQKVWRPLFDAIEKRWQARFGKNEIARLRESLWALVSQIDANLPDCLPILGFGLFSRVRDHIVRTPSRGKDQNKNRAGSSLPLSALLSRALLAFALDFEHDSDLSLAISANLMRVLGEDQVSVRELALLAGVSKEAINTAMGILQKKRLAVVGPDPGGSRAKVARLTAKGLEARQSCIELLAAIEERWRKQFGRETVRNLRESLGRLVGDAGPQSPLFPGLDCPEGWRASVPKLHTLPHYPMVLHRGGFPDGS